MSEKKVRPGIVLALFPHEAEMLQIALEDSIQSPYWEVEEKAVIQILIQGVEDARRHVCTTCGEFKAEDERVAVGLICTECRTLNSKETK